LKGTGKWKNEKGEKKLIVASHLSDRSTEGNADGILGEITNRSPEEKQEISNQK